MLFKSLQSINFKSSNTKTQIANTTSSATNGSNNVALLDVNGAVQVGDLININPLVVHI